MFKTHWSNGFFQCKENDHDLGPWACPPRLKIKSAQKTRTSASNKRVEVCQTQTSQGTSEDACDFQHRPAVLPCQGTDGGIENTMIKDFTPHPYEATHPWEVTDRGTPPFIGWICMQAMVISRCWPPAFSAVQWCQLEIFAECSTKICPPCGWGNPFIGFKWLPMMTEGIWIPSANQTWLAGNSSINGGFNRKITDNLILVSGPFSSTPSWITRGYMMRYVDTQSFASSLASSALEPAELLKTGQTARPGAAQAWDPRRGEGTFEGVFLSPKKSSRSPMECPKSIEFPYEYHGRSLKIWPMMVRKNHPHKSPWSSRSAHPCESPLRKSCAPDVVLMHIVHCTDDLLHEDGRNHLKSHGKHRCPRR